jgi:hypothetical protein
MEKTTITLRRGEILTRKTGVREVACLAGALWVTARNCADDILLRAGERYRKEGLRDVCVQAFEESTVTMEAGRKKAPRLTNVRPFAKPLSDLLRALRTTREYRHFKIVRIGHPRGLSE